MATATVTVEALRTLARNGRARALAEFLGDLHLEQYGRLFAQLEGSR